MPLRFALSELKTYINNYNNATVLNGEQVRIGRTRVAVDAGDGDQSMTWLTVGGRNLPITSAAA